MRPPPGGELSITPPDRVACVEPVEAGAAQHKIEEHYDVLEHRLGRGHFSEVRLGLKRVGRQRVAIKVVQKEHLKNVKSGSGTALQVCIPSALSLHPSPSLLHHCCIPSASNLQLIFIFRLSSCAP